jgi:hypothetical protein
VLKDVPSVLALVKEEIIRSLLHWDTEEVLKRVDVLHHELLSKSSSCMLEKLLTWGNEDDVVDVEQQVTSVGGMKVNEQRSVWLGLCEAERDLIGGETVVPSTLAGLMNSVG